MIPCIEWILIELNNNNPLKKPYCYFFHNSACIADISVIFLDLVTFNFHKDGDCLDTKHLNFLNVKLWLFCIVTVTLSKSENERPTKNKCIIT